MALPSEADYAKLNNDILVVHQQEFAADVAASDFQAIADAYMLSRARGALSHKTSDRS